MRHNFIICLMGLAALSWGSPIPPQLANTVEDIDRLDNPQAISECIPAGDLCNRVPCCAGSACVSAEVSLMGRSRSTCDGMQHPHSVLMNMSNVRTLRISLLSRMRSNLVYMFAVDMLSLADVTNDDRGFARQPPYFRCKVWPG